jgi:hypothetical protein
MGWSRDRENVGNIGDGRIFRQVQAARRIEFLDRYTTTTILADNMV